MSVGIGELTRAQAAAVDAGSAAMVEEIAALVGVVPTWDQFVRGTEIVSAHQAEVARTGVLDSKAAYQIGADLRDLLRG